MSVDDPTTLWRWHEELSLPDRNVKPDPDSVVRHVATMKTYYASRAGDGYKPTDPLKDLIRTVEGASAGIQFEGIIIDASKGRRR